MVSKALSAIWPLFLIGLGLSSCATYQSQITQSRALVVQGRYNDALEKLKPLAEKPGDDQLVYLLDYATLQFIAGQYRESIQSFLKADQLTELQDYHSVTNVIGATLGGEEMIQYKGESFEKYLINVMLAFNFTMLGEVDSALVEARRINEKILKMKMDGRDPYELSPFAKYLSGLLWESQLRWDDAYISYEQTYQLDAANPFLPKDLLRSADMARRPDAFKKWKREFELKSQDNSWKFDRKYGELVVLLQQGWVPRKQPQPGSHRFPKLYPVYSETESAQVRVEPTNSVCETRMVYNIERVAIETLEKDYGALIARRVGAIVAKEVVADQIRQKDELLGFIAWITMHLSDRADLRQWSMLPRSIQICRFQLEPGEYDVHLQGLDHGGGKTSENQSFSRVKVEASKKTFLTWRTVQ